MDNMMEDISGRLIPATNLMVGVSSSPLTAQSTFDPGNLVRQPLAPTYSLEVMAVGSMWGSVLLKTADCATEVHATTLMALLEGLISEYVD